MYVHFLYLILEIENEFGNCILIAVQNFSYFAAASAFGKKYRGPLDVLDKNRHGDTQHHSFNYLKLEPGGN